MKDEEWDSEDFDDDDDEGMELNGDKDGNWGIIELESRYPIMKKRWGFEIRNYSYTHAMFLTITQFHRPLPSPL